MLDAVLNVLIPPEGNLPGAGDLGVGRFVEDAVASNPESIRLFTNGLREIEIGASAEAGFGLQPLSRQVSALKAIEEREPGFFGELVRQTYNSYYTNTRVFEAIGYSLRAPAPGEPPALLDESLLEKQRQRAPFWRKV